MMSANKASPKISIITVNLNGGKSIERTIRSVIDQSYEDKEYIVVDGGSSDESCGILERFAGVIDQLVIEPDDGISDAFNKGLYLASGDLIGITSSDDFLTEHSLERVAESYAEARPDVVYGNAGYLDGDDLCFVRPDSLRKFFIRQPLKHSSVFVSKTAYQTYGLFDRSYRFAMDYELLLRFFVSGARFQYLDEVLSVYSGGGLAQGNLFETVREVRDISVVYGYSKRRADVHMGIKKAKWLVKRGLSRARLNWPLRIYRAISKRYFRANPRLRKVPDSTGSHPYL